MRINQTRYISNVIYHKFSYSDVSYGFSGKNVMLEFLFISHWIKSKNCRDSNLRNSENN